MRLYPELGGSLPKMHSLSCLAFFSLLIVNIIQINGSFISEVKKQVEALFSNFSFLLVAKDKIYPVPNIFRDVIRFKLLPVFYDEIISIFGPFRHLDVVNPLFLLSHTKIMLLNIKQNLRHVKKFGK